MQAELFYQSQADDDVIPLYLINKGQWEEKQKNFEPFEEHSFCLQQFNGNIGDMCLIPDIEGKKKCIKVYIGTGDNNEALAMAQAATRLPPGYYKLQQHLSPFAMANWALAQYRFDRYKKQDIQPRVLILDDNLLTPVLNGVQNIYLVRDLINTPTNDMTPGHLAEIVADMAQQHGAEFMQWVGDELLTANFPAVHAVGRASIHAPRMLSLTWGKKQYPLITLVGKGVCFDTGGLDIKPSNSMRLMKKDMGGAAHVIGLAQWIMMRKLPVQLQVLIPTVENAIGPDAFRPGDVLTMRNGLTVEVDNTDAEGRLILADALSFAGDEKPDLIIDFSTLTGAARVALGTDVAAMFTNDDKAALALAEASKETQDPLWRLPLYAGYDNLLDSSIADMANCSTSPFGGAITAALFLQRFVPENTSWVHFDIMAWNMASKPGRPEGGEAMAIRAIAHYLQKKYA